MKGRKGARAGGINFGGSIMICKQKLVVRV